MKNTLTDAYLSTTTENNKNKPEWLNLNSPQIQKYDVIIGWDTEYRNKEYQLDLEALQLKKNGSLLEEQLEELFNAIDKRRSGDCRYNDVISYQYSAYSFRNNKYVQNIIYTYDKVNKKFHKRLRLNQIISHALKDLEMGWSDCNPRKNKKSRKLNILLVSHFGIAELSTLRDREKFYNKLQEVQDTLISFEPIEQSITIDNGKDYFTVLVSWRDTMLISGDGEKSLDSLGKVVGIPKIKLEQEDYMDMVSLMEKTDEDGNNLFEKYAIEDAKISLAYFCSFMDDFYQVTDKYKVTEEPTTASGAGVLFFRKYLEVKSLEAIENKKKDKKFIENKLLGKERNVKGKIVKSKERIFDESFAGNAYYGGLNNFYKIGKYKCKEDEVVLDIDFSGAYTNAMAVLAAIDYQQKEENAFMDWIYLAKMFGDFDLIKHVKTGIFLTEFNFPNHIYQTAIPQLTEGGLIYTYDGKDFCTLPEFTEAVVQGGVTKNSQVVKATIYKELMINGEIFLPFAEFLGYITRKEEAIVDKKSPQRRILKLMRNGFYGKLAQGIKYREVYDLEGKKIPLDESAITDPRYASQITGIIRTALVTMINTIHAWEGCKVFNATTDGLTISIPKPEDWEIKTWKIGDYYPEENKILTENDKKIIGKVIIDKTFQELAPELYEHLTQQLPIKLLMLGKKNLQTKNQNWVEIKYIGDECRTAQTRANYITYKGITQTLARGNISSKIMTDAEVFNKFTDAEEVFQIRINNISGLREIKGKDSWDLVDKKQWDKKTNTWKSLKKRVNIGFDGKRKPIDIGAELVETTQHQNLEEWETWRSPAQKIKKQGIIRATLENILFKKEAKSDDKTLRLQGGQPKTIIRAIVSMNWKYEWNQTKITHIELAKKLNQILIRELNKSEEDLLNEGKLITEMDLKNWKRNDRSRLSRSLPDTQKARKIILEIAHFWGINVDQDKWNLLLGGGK